MKVQCGQCPAKYAVSDERIQDKKVRIHCKRCGASIVVDGKVDPPLVTSTPARKSQRPPSTPPEESTPAPEREPESRPSPRPVAHTIMGGLEAPAAERLRARSSPPPRPMRSPASPVHAEEEARLNAPADHRGLGDPSPGADPSRWRVALTKQDLRWMTTSEIVEAYQAGAVKLETFVFRAGMPTWVTLLEVAEIAEALSEAGTEYTSGSSSLSPSRSPGSQPPPRRPPVRSGGFESTGRAELSELEMSEPLPFALVAERANGASVPPVAPARDEPMAPAPLARPQMDKPPVERVSPPAVARPPLPAFEHATPPPFAAAREASGSSRWIWVAVVLLLLGAVVALIGPRYGLKLL
jgi:predicted Zn finger-like uncharacterized protein